jgi:hypothetical protein
MVEAALASERAEYGWRREDINIAARLEQPVERHSW